MKTWEKIITILSLGLLIGIGLAFKEKQMLSQKTVRLEALIAVQEAELEHLRQRKTDLLENSEIAVAKGFLERWKEVMGRDAPYRDVVVSGGVMRIYFADIYEATAFLGEAPEVIARFALDYLLEETGCVNGRVEYYTPLKRKLFSLSEHPFPEESSF